MVFLNDEELSSAAVSKLAIAVQYMMDAILTENDSTILDVVYSTYAPSSYKRTGEFQEAWDTRVGTAYKTAEGEFYFKPEIMTVDYDYFNPETMDADYNSGPPRHASVDRESVAQYMADILYQGAMGCIYRPTNRNAWKVLDKWLSNTKFRQIFEDGLNYSGLEWKRSKGIVTKTTESI